MLYRLMGLSKNRHGVYEFRKVIPPELRPLFSGKAEIRKSLGTKDAKAAAAAHKREEAAYNERIASSGQAFVLAPADAQRLADNWLAFTARNETI